MTMPRIDTSIQRVRRRLLALSIVAALQTTPLAACSAGSPRPGSQPSSSPSAEPNTANGRHFPVCGGVSDETISRLTGVSKLLTTARNSVGCQWLAGGSIKGPLISFAWFRGSPIGRERKTEELSRTRVDDIDIDGHNGFIAVATDPRLGDRLCDVGIQYEDDFFEWSVQFTRKPFPNPCDIAIELSRQSIAAAK
jgi:hypothetical protein